MTDKATVREAVANATAAAARMFVGRDDLSGDYDQVRADAKRAARRTVVVSEPERALDAPETGASRHSGRTVQSWHHDTLEAATYDADARAAKSLVRASFAVVADSTGFLVIPQWATRVDDRLHSTGN